MEEPLTEELLTELLSSETPTGFLDDYELDTRELSAYLCQLLEEKGLRRPEVVRAAGLDATYGYQLFKGERRRPSRDKVIQLAFAMGLSLRECDRLLQAAGVSKLYCKNRRDAIILFCLDRKATLMQTNAELFRHGEDILE